MQYYGQYEQEHYNEENISVTLHNSDLWTQFHGITNEMIVTKVGRRMFPIISVLIRGLNPDEMYTVELTFDQIDAHRWRYASGQWQPGTKPDPPINRPAYQHPDSPNYGRTWMRDVVSFPKVKLTNKIDNHGASQVLLNSLHKYRPKLSIIHVMSKRKIYEISFEETEFIAVTAYQNEEVKNLKIRHNPFAKAFLDSGNVKRELSEEDNGNNNHLMFCTQDSSSGGPDRLKLDSYRSSPYAYSRPIRKSSPTNTYSYPSTSNSPTLYPTTTTASQFLLSDNSAYYSNAYYSPTPSYYFPYGASPAPSATPYSFMAPFNYPLSNDANLDSKTFFQMQPTNENNNYHLSSLFPISNDTTEQY